MTAVLRVEGRGVRYGALVALDGVSWEVAAGEVLGIIGPNGAGKSSCYDAATHMTRRTGRVWLDGREVTAVPPQALLVNRMMVDQVVEAPGGAHFTTAAPDYGRDERFQRHYAQAAAQHDSWAEFVATYLTGSEADYQAAVRRFTAAGEAGT